MRDKKRIKRILKLLEERWNEMPDMRFCQFLINWGFAKDSDLWNREDDGVEEVLANTNFLKGFDYVRKK